jgi:hypothetical protein
MNYSVSLCPWCGTNGIIIPVPGAAGERYDKCSRCNNFVPKTVEENMEGVTISENMRQAIENNVATHGEEYRAMITDALIWLDAHEESWDLNQKIHRGWFIDGLVEARV